MCAFLVVWYGGQQAAALSANTPPASVPVLCCSSWCHSTFGLVLAVRACLGLCGWADRLPTSPETLRQWRAAPETSFYRLAKWRPSTIWCVTGPMTSDRKQNWMICLLENHSFLFLFQLLSILGLHGWMQHYYQAMCWLTVTLSNFRWRFLIHVCWHFS